MTNIIQIKRSNTTATPSYLNPGELGYSNVSQVLFIGSTDGGTVVPIAGTRNPGTLTANQALVANSTSGINSVKVGNIVFSGSSQNININGSVGNVGQLLISGGSGNAYWTTPGSNTQIQFNDSGSLNAVSSFTFDKSTNTLTVDSGFTTNSTLTNVVSLSVTGNTTLIGSTNANTVNAVSYKIDNIFTVNTTTLILGNTTSTIANSFIANSSTFSIGNSTVNVTTNSTYVVTNVGIFYTPQSGVAANTSEGSTFYDLTNHALNYYADDSSTPIEIAQQTIFRAVNKSGTALPFGSAVYISGAQGNRPSVNLAIANSSSFFNVAGFVLSSSGIANNAEGFILSNGLLQGINTSPFSVGNTLYLSPTTPGNLTQTQPSYPNYSVTLGQALNSTNNGKVYVNISPNYQSGIPNTAIVISNGITRTYSNNFLFDYANNVLYIGNSTANTTIGYKNVSGSVSFIQILNNANSSIEESLSNISNGANASSDMIVYDSLGLNGPNYLDFGINSNGYNISTWTINGPSDGYLYTSNTNLSIGTAGANYLNFFTGNTLAANERMRITSGGNVGIGNTAPDATLHVQGTANVSGNVVIGGSISSANLTASLFTGNVTGTASNATNLNSQPGSYYTNATNITTGTLPYAQLGANVVNTSAAFTITGMHTYSNGISFSNTISANGSNGTSGYFITSAGSSGNVYWSAGQLVFNVKNYGAVGDGSTDDRTSIQAAITAAAAVNGVVYFPSSANPYMLKTSLTLSSNVTLYAYPGTVTLKALTGSSPTVLLLNGSSVNNIFIYGLTFDGGGPTYGYTSPVTQLYRTTNVTFDACSWQNTRGIAMNLSGVNQTNIKNCQYINIGNYWKTSLSQADAKQAIAFSSGVAGTWGLTNQVTGCYFSDIGLDAVSLGGPLDGVIVTNNRFLLQNSQLTLISSSAYPAAIYGTQVSNAVIHGNTIKNAQGNGIDISAMVNTVVGHNQIVGCGSAGIGLFGQNAYGNNQTVEIIGNSLINNGQWSGTPHKGGITLICGSTTYSSDIVIIGNISIDTQATHTQQYGIYNGTTIAGYYNNYTNLWIDPNNDFSVNLTASFGGFLTDYSYPTSPIFGTQAVVGNSTVNNQISNTSIIISNSTTTTVANLTGIYIGNTTTNVVISNTVSSFGGNVSITGTANVTGNVTLGSSAFFVGNGNYLTSVNATNITSGTLPYAQLGVNVVNTTSNFTVAGNINFTGTNNFFSTAIYANANFVANSSVIYFGNSTSATSSNQTSVSIGNSTINVQTFVTGSVYNTNNSFIPSITKSQGNSTNFVYFNFNIAGGNNTSNPQWQGYHFNPPSGITNATPSAIFPKISHYFSYTTNANPTDLYYNIQGFNSPGVPIGIKIYSYNGTAAQGIDITGTGNVGIGNTAPDATLHVQGTANVSGNVVIGGVLTNSGNVTLGSAAFFVGNGNYITTVNATNITTGTLPMAQLNANVVNTSANFTITGLNTFQANINVGNSTVNSQFSNAQIVLNNGNVATLTATSLLVGNATVNTTVNTTGFYVSGQAIYTNATNISSGTLAFARLPANSVFWSNTNTFTANQTFTGLLNMKTFVENASSPAISTNTLTLDLSNTSIFTVNLNSAITTMTISNAPATAGLVSGFVVVFTYTGTTFSVVWPASVRWPNGTAPILTTTNNKRDVFTFFTTDNGTSYNAFISGQNI